MVIVNGRFVSEIQKRKAITFPSCTTTAFDAAFRKHKAKEARHLVLHKANEELRKMWERTVK